MGLRSCPLIMQTLIHVYTYVNAGYLYLYISIQDLRVYIYSTYVSYVHRPICAHMETISVLGIWQSVLHVYLVITKPQV